MLENGPEILETKTKIIAHHIIKLFAGNISVFSIDPHGGLCITKQMQLCQIFSLSLN
jgi:hypothetical protein